MMRSSEAFLGWLAGMIDGEGSFVIQVYVNRMPTAKGRRYCAISPVVYLGLRAEHRRYLEPIITETGYGRMYMDWHSTTTTMSRWQTTNLKDSIDFTVLILPYLRVKKDIAQQFLEACNLLQAARARRPGAKRKGERVLSLETVLSLAKMATALNNRSHFRNPRYQSYEQLEIIIREIYAEIPWPARTRCRHGHLWTKTAFVNSNGYHECRICSRETKRRYENKIALASAS